MPQFAEIRRGERPIRPRNKSSGRPGRTGTPASGRPEKAACPREPSRPGRPASPSLDRSAAQSAPSAPRPKLPRTPRNLQGALRRRARAPNRRRRPKPTKKWRGRPNKTGQPNPARRKTLPRRRAWAQTGQAAAPQDKAAAAPAATRAPTDRPSAEKRQRRPAHAPRTPGGVGGGSAPHPQPRPRLQPLPPRQPTETGLNGAGPKPPARDAQRGLWPPNPRYRLNSPPVWPALRRCAGAASTGPALRRRSASRMALG